LQLKIRVMVLQPQPIHIMRNILVLTANPANTSKSRLEHEVRDIEEGLRRSKNYEQFVLHQRWAVRPRDIQRAMLDIMPQVIHFCGNGSQEGGLFFEDDVGQAKLVDGTALARLFKLFADHIECVVLNGCYSTAQAEAIAQYINYVVGMNAVVDDRALIEFAVGFYDALGAGRTVEFAFEVGCSAVELSGMGDGSIPVLLQKKSSNEPLPQSISTSLPLGEGGPETSVSIVSNNQAVEVFFSYSHEDENLRNHLAKHLSTLKRQGVINDWHDREISAGSEWANVIDTHIKSAQIILLLISANFLASDYCYNTEAMQALERHELGEAIVIPIILKPVDLEGLPFNKLKILPNDGKPITSWSNQDEAFLNVIQGIRGAIENLKSFSRLSKPS